MSKSAVVFGSTDLGRLQENMVLVVKNMSGTVIPNAGWSMTESQLGIYEIDVPLAVDLCTFKITDATDLSGATTYEGFIGGDTATISTSQYSALAKEATLLSFIGSFVGTSFTALSRVIRNLTVRVK